MDSSESSFYFEMSSQDFASVNVPGSVFSIFMNIFFIYCLVFQQHEQEQLKQPLNVLQGILLGCNITINVCTLLKVCINIFPPSWDLLPYVVTQCVVYIMMTSVTSSFWQNVFYYCQITQTPSRFIWLKKNIRAFIYCALLINGIVYLFGLSLITAVFVMFPNDASDNNTSTHPDTNSSFMVVSYAWFVVFCMTLGLLMLNLCGMSTSSCATVIYLWKHLKNMEESNTLSSPRFQTQIRMTIRSIAIHAILHFICSMGVIVNLHLWIFSTIQYDLNQNITCTIVSFYALGTSMIIGIAQSLFRQKIAYAWKKMFPIF